jgi:beta-glucosidase
MTMLPRNTRLFVLAAFLTVISFFSLAAAAQEQSTDVAKSAAVPRYKDASLPIQDRVADLLPRMTLEEKVEQISGGWEDHIQVIDPTGTFTSEKARDVIKNIWGTNQNFSARDAAILRNGVQRYLREKSRLGIPELFPGEGLHGLMEPGATSFPQALGLAATWDPALVKRVFTAVGDEAGSRGVGQLFSPCWTLRAILAGAAPRRRMARILISFLAWAWPQSRDCRATNT